MSEKRIVLVKGDDTDWNGQDFLTLRLITTILDLSEYKAKITLGSIEKTFNDISSGEIVLNYTSSESASLPCGKIDGVLELFKENKKATIESRLPFLVVSSVHGDAIVTEPFEMTINVEQAGQNILNIDIEAGVSVEAGTTTTLPPGSNATVENVGTENHLKLNFGIPRGEKGETGENATIQVGSTTTGQPGTEASVVNSGTSTNAILDFTIPRGDKGEQGIPGTGMQAVVVQTLPATGETGNIYLVPKETPGQEDIYDEWIWAIISQPNTYGWEHIGTTDIDLSGYMTDTLVDNVSVVSNGVASIPRANGSNFGVVKINSPNGIAMSSNGQLYINKATDAEIEGKTNNYKPLVPSNLDKAVAEGISDNSITLTETQKKKARTWQGVVNSSDLLPDFDSMTPIETHTFDIRTTDYYELFTKPNDAGTFDNPTDAQFEVWCRITTTNTEGTSTTPRIYQELDCVFREFGSSTQVIYGVIRSKPESVTAATTGIQTVRSIYPKATNSGKQWGVELKAYNTSARTVTVQVYKTATGVVWKDTAVTSTYDSDHQNTVSINAYNSPGYLFLGPIAGTISSAAAATSSGYITGSMSKTLASSTLKNTGYVITGNSLLFKIKGQSLLSGIATTNEPIDVDFGICQAGATAAATATSSYTYTNFFQKHQFTPASSVNFAEAYDNGDMLYARFTLSNGEIYSDNICSKTPTAGHTWYCIGMATSSTAINFDNTESYFFTLDANGKLTHINGKEIAGGGGGSSTPQPRTVYDKTSAITSGTVALADDTIFYTDTPAASTTYTIDTTALTQTGSIGCVYFNVVINMPSTAVGIDFTTNNSVTWTEGTTPDMSTGGRTYLLAFQSFDAGTSWIGSLATWWTTPTP